MRKLHCFMANMKYRDNGLPGNRGPRPVTNLSIIPIAIGTVAW
jgi:hypothetical protein